jgi:hypothetical protein
VYAADETAALIEEGEFLYQRSDHQLLSKRYMVIDIHTVRESLNKYPSYEDNDLTSIARSLIKHKLVPIYQ